jgi:hypothetical protein
VVSFTSLPIYPREKALGTHWMGAGWAPVSVWTTWRTEKFLTLPGLELRPLCSPACRTFSVHVHNIQFMPTKGITVRLLMCFFLCAHLSLYISTSNNSTICCSRLTMFTFLSAITEYVTWVSNIIYHIYNLPSILPLLSRIRSEVVGPFLGDGQLGIV